MAHHPALLELMARVLSDSPIPWDGVSGAYVFGQTSDNESSVLNRGAKIWKRWKKLVCVCDGETEHGYPGFANWRKELLLRGVPSNFIVPIQMPPDMGVNTLTEAQTFVRYAKSHTWRAVAVIATPFHQLRAFMTTVNISMREYPELLVYSSAGTPLKWSECVRHSQGTQMGRRSELLYDEFDRIERYKAKEFGGLASTGEVLAYLNRRDAHAAATSTRTSR